jgi:hypothetical protein
MSPEPLFRIHLVFGYVAWLLCFGAYIWPRLKVADRVDAHRAIATLHSFRFFGLVFILPGVVGHLPAGFATVAAYGDFATGLLAMLALLTVRMRPLFWLFVVAFNLAGVADLVADYYDAIRLGLAPLSGELGAAYWIPIILCAHPDDHACRRVLPAGASGRRGRLDAARRDQRGRGVASGAVDIRLQAPYRSHDTALSCQRRSRRCDRPASVKKITMPAIDSRMSAANMRGMLSRYCDSAMR